MGCWDLSICCHGSKLRHHEDNVIFSNSFRPMDDWAFEVNNIAKLITAIGIIRIINRTKDINKSKKRFI